ncbi:hypothetical protein LX36DRAFT_402900 [Colletotrichum falcatum]|nr:hypothetical protein LX36DRAFT_402900 [Colletotrichum falcatum]
MFRFREMSWRGSEDAVPLVASNPLLYSQAPQRPCGRRTSTESHSTGARVSPIDRRPKIEEKHHTLMRRDGPWLLGLANCHARPFNQDIRFLQDGVKSVASTRAIPQSPPQPEATHTVAVEPATPEPCHWTAGNMDYWRRLTNGAWVSVSTFFFFFFYIVRLQRAMGGVVNGNHVRQLLLGWKKGCAAVTEAERQRPSSAQSQTLLTIFSPFPVTTLESMDVYELPARTVAIGRVSTLH